MNDGKDLSKSKLNLKTQEGTLRHMVIEDNIVLHAPKGATLSLSDGTFMVLDQAIKIEKDG